MYHNGGQWQIVMELLKGGELFDRIVARRHYDERGARHLMTQITSAIKVYTYVLVVDHVIMLPQYYLQLFIYNVSTCFMIILINISVGVTWT